MRVAKCHPQLGWLRLEAADYSRSLDRLLAERDALADASHSGPAPAYLRWVWEQELPALAQDPRYRQQINAHLQALHQKTEDLSEMIEKIAGGLLSDQADTEREITDLQTVLEGPSE